MNFRPLALALLSFAGLAALPAVAAAQVTTDPRNLDFAPTGIGAQTPDQAVTFTNTSQVTAVTITAFVITGTHPGDFLNTSGITNIKLSPNGDVPLTIAFRPAGSGQRDAILRAELEGGGMVDVPLKGVGLGPKATASPNPVALGGTRLGGTLGPVTVAITNGGGSLLTITSVALAGANAAEFSLMNGASLPITLGPGMGFNVTVSSQPTGIGVRQASLQIASNDPDNAVLDVPVSATAGEPALTLGNTAIGFGDVRVGNTSLASTVTVRNSGFSDLTISSVTVDGANPGDFVLDVSRLPMSPLRIPAGASGEVSVVFRPTLLGSRNARVVITSDDPGMAQRTITLIGKGTESVLAAVPGSIDFLEQTVFRASPPRSITITNTGGDAANVTMINFGGAQPEWFRFQGVAPSLPLRVPAMGSVKIDVVALPLSVGAGTATVTLVTDDAKTPSFQIPLSTSGVGADLTVTPAFVDFGPVGFNTQATPIVVTLANAGTAPLTIASFYLNDIDSTGFFTVGKELDPDTVIDPGKDVKVEVNFKPQMNGPARAEIELETDDPTARLVRIPLDGSGVTAGLMVAPNMLGFGQLFVNTTSPPQKVTITNTSAQALAIQSLTIGGAGAAMYKVDEAGPFTIDSMRSRDVYVTYAPTAGASHPAELIISPMGFAQAKVKLTGQGVAPMLQAALAGSGSVLDFSDVVVGTEYRLGFKLKNVSGATIDIDAIRSNDPQFVVVLPANLRLQSGGVTDEIQVVFTPASEGAKTAKLEVLLKQTGATVILAVSAAGNGVAAVMRPDTGCAVVGAGARGRDAAALLLLAAAPLAFALRRRRARA